MLLKIITNTLKKVLFIDDKNMQQVHNICCSGIKIVLESNFIVMILTRTGLHRKESSFLAEVPLIKLIGVANLQSPVIAQNF